MVLNEGLVLGLLGLWSLGLTAWIIFRELQLRRFLGRGKEGDIRRLLEDVLKNLASTGEFLDRVSGAMREMRKKDFSHIQKIGLVRFNPFRDAGGNQSFALALLNEENTGIVLTGLHARETTRLYIKDISDGKSKAELSKEEKEAVLRAVGKSSVAGKKQ